MDTSKVARKGKDRIRLYQQNIRQAQRFQAGLGISAFQKPVKEERPR